MAQILFFKDLVDRIIFVRGIKTGSNLLIYQGRCEPAQGKSQLYPQPDKKVE